MARKTLIEPGLIPAEGDVFSRILANDRERRRQDPPPPEAVEEPEASPPAAEDTPSPTDTTARSHAVNTARSHAVSTATVRVREPTTRITVDLPDSMHRLISLLSVEERRSIKSLVIEALERTYFQTPESGR